MWLLNFASLHSLLSDTSQTEGQLLSVFNMSVNFSVERRGLYWWRWWKAKRLLKWSTTRWTMEELMLMTISLVLQTGPSTGSVKTSYFLRSVLCPLPLPQLEKCLCSRHQLGSPPGQIRKSRFLRQRGMRVEVAKAGTKMIGRRRTHVEGSRAPCLSETLLSSWRGLNPKWVMLLPQRHGHFPLAMDILLWFVLQCCPCPGHLLCSHWLQGSLVCAL